MENCKEERQHRTLTSIEACFVKQKEKKLILDMVRQMYDAMGP